VTGRAGACPDALNLLAGGFPGGSITAHPTDPRMQIIEDLEPVRRACIAAAIGYIGFFFCEGQMDLNIAYAAWSTTGPPVLLGGADSGGLRRRNRSNQEPWPRCGY